MAESFGLFDITRKGFDPDQVRTAIARYGETLSSLAAENDRLRKRVYELELRAGPTSVEATAIVAKAQADAQVFIDEANAHAEALEVQLTERVSDAQRELDRINAEIDELRRESGARPSYSGGQRGAMFFREA